MEKDRRDLLKKIGVSAIGVSISGVLGYRLLFDKPVSYYQEKDCKRLVVGRLVRDELISIDEFERRLEEDPTYGEFVKQGVDPLIQKFGMQTVESFEQGYSIRDNPRNYVILKLIREDTNKPLEVRLMNSYGRPVEDFYHRIQKRKEIETTPRIAFFMGNVDCMGIPFGHVDTKQHWILSDTKRATKATDSAFIMTNQNKYLFKHYGTTSD